MPLHVLLMLIHVGWVVIGYVMLLLVKSCCNWMVPTLPVSLYCLIGSCVIVFIEFGRFGRLIQHGWRLVWWGQGLVSFPVICPMNPGMDDSNWSTDTTSPGDRWLLLSPKLFLCLSGLVLHGVLVADAL